MRALVLSNPNSTSLTPASFRAALAPLREVAHLHARHTAYRGHAEEIASQVSAENFDAIVVIGGDGTVNEVINGLIGTHPTPDRRPKLGIIPTGSANVFARALGFPNQPAEAAAQLAELLQEGAYRRLPVGKINDRWFCVNVGFGLDAEVINRMDKLRSQGVPATPWHYSLVSFGVWRRLRAKPPRIHFEATTRQGAVISGHAPFVIASNTNPWTYAGPLPVVTNPNHDIEDGCSLFALTELTEASGLRTVRNMIRHSLVPASRSHIDAHEFRVDDATSITLTSNQPLKWQVDGEYAGEATELSVTTFPKALDVICPKMTQIQ